MSFQFDVEEQAQNEEMLIGYPEIIPSVFKPIAPVTVAYEWSPFPSAIQLIGAPIHIDTQQGHTLAVFKPRVLESVNTLSSDEKQFYFLLSQAYKLAYAENAFILLAGTPGWSYEEMDSYVKLEDVRELMRNFGFVYTLRKPIQG